MHTMHGRTLCRCSTFQTRTFLSIEAVASLCPSQSQSRQYTCMPYYLCSSRAVTPLPAICRGALMYAPGYCTAAGMRWICMFMLPGNVDTPCLDEPLHPLPHAWQMEHRWPYQLCNFHILLRSCVVTLLNKSSKCKCLHTQLHTKQSRRPLSDVRVLRPEVKKV